MDEVKTVQRMRLVLDAAVHVHATDTAGMPLDGSGRVDDLELLPVGSDAEIVACDDPDDREHRALGLPALGAAAGMIEGDVAA